VGGKIGFPVDADDLKSFLQRSLENLYSKFEVFGCTWILQFHCHAAWRKKAKPSIQSWRYKTLPWTVPIKSQ